MKMLILLTGCVISIGQTNPGSYTRKQGSQLCDKIEKKNFKILVLSYVFICSRTLLIFLTAADLNLNKVICLINSFPFSFFRIGL